MRDHLVRHVDLLLGLMTRSTLGHARTRFASDGGIVNSRGSMLVRQLLLGRTSADVAT